MHKVGMDGLQQLLVFVLVSGDSEGLTDSVNCKMGVNRPRKLFPRACFFGTGSCARVFG